METYREEWKYEWKPSKAKISEVSAVDTFADLLPPSMETNGTLVYVIDEKQLYRCKHTSRYVRVP